MRIDRAGLRKIVEVALEVEWDNTDPGHYYEDPDDVASVRERIRNGSMWVWANVTVRVTVHGLSSQSSLGCCSYDSEADFKQGGYYDDMIDEGVEDLAQVIEKTINTHGVMEHDKILCLWCAARPP